MKLIDQTNVDIPIRMICYECEFSDKRLVEFDFNNEEYFWLCLDCLDKALKMFLNPVMPGVELVIGFQEKEQNQ